MAGEKENYSNMKTNQLVAAIIPAYNEEETIAGVVRPLVDSKLVSEVIVISDGSTDQTEEVARSEGAKVYRLEKNAGKGAAMLHALKWTKAPVLAFFDADLFGLNQDHIERILLPVVSGSRMMNVGIRDRGRFAMSVSHHLPLIGGERAMAREVIENVSPEFLQGFMVESALNYACRSRGFAYGSVILPGLSIRRKCQKVGIPRGVIQYAKMWTQVVKAMIVVRLANKFGRF